MSLGLALHTVTADKQPWNIVDCLLRCDGLGSLFEASQW